jgi:serine protease inhibitor
MAYRTKNAIEHVNALTKRWLARLDGASSVASGLGVWPLLAYLADAADGPGRAELAEALGVPADDAAEAARAVLDVVASMPSAAMALGLWTKASVPVEPAWLAKVPLGTYGWLTGDEEADKKRLDAWASEHTRGMVPTYPLRLDPRTLLTIASALCVETEWVEQFQPGWGFGEGPWRGRSQALSRSTGDLRCAAVAATPLGPMTMLDVVGGGDVDVRLVLGPESAAPGDVLAAGVDVAGRKVPLTTADRLPLGLAGPGLEVDEIESVRPGDVLAVSTVAFKVTADHDLLDNADVFGLRSVMDPARGHFPGMSSVPLCVNQAKQSAVAEFSAEGFRAAAVTALGMMVGSAMPTKRYRTKVVRAVFNRPFAYYAVHRSSGLILAAGWVAEPEGFEPEND